MSMELIIVIVVVLLAAGIAVWRKQRTGSFAHGGGVARAAGMRKSPGTPISALCRVAPANARGGSPLARAPASSSILDGFTLVSGNSLLVSCDQRSVVRRYQGSASAAASYPRFTAGMA
jgi:hypothetical protein